ncbi:MAG: phosphotransferase [Deltaproteobacteria bacterium]|nr:phosphotransferase [Deltaproteobacteria bacterium]
MRIELSEAVRAKLPERWRRAFDWAERTLGGRVVAWEPQPRWRPACFFELERNGARLRLYWRGARSEWARDARPLEREMRVLEVLEKNGIRVPHVHGLSTDPPGLVLERLPGRFNLATAKDERHRRAVLDEYLIQLSKIHSIPIEEFEAIGFDRPRSAEQIGLGETRRYERAYRASKQRPEPMIEFQLAWCKRNVPRDRHELSFLACDAGQFMFDDAGLTGLIDFEMGYIGDYAADLAALRTRDLSEPIGDLGRAMNRYGEISGRDIDLRAIDYHTIRFALVNPLSLASVVAKPGRDANYVQYLGWFVVYGRCGLEVMARFTGVPLEPPRLPEAAPSRRAVAHAHLVDLLDPARAVGAIEDARSDARTGRSSVPDAAAEERAYDFDRMHRLAVYLENSDRHGAALEADDLDDVGRILGTRPTTWQEADLLLERLVLEAGPERDAELIRYFHRRLVREESLLHPVLREQQNASFPPLED